MVMLLASSRSSAFAINTGGWEQMSEDRIDRMRKLSKELGWEFLGDTPTHQIYQEGYIVRSAKPTTKPQKKSSISSLDSAPPKESSKVSPEEE